MNKYQKLFMDQTGDNLERILNPLARTDERSVYRMLHSIKGTSGTIGLQAWYEAALILLEQFDEHGDRVFSGEELAEQLSRLTALMEQAKREYPAPEPEPIAGREDPKVEPAVSLRNALAQRLGVVPEEQPSNPTEATVINKSNLRTSTGLSNHVPNSATATGQASDSVSGAGVSPLPESEGTILLLDDDLGLLALLKDVLEEQGFTVFATPRFDRAMEWFYEMRPDCAVLDVLLPEQSGFELLEGIRELCDHYMIPVVLMTGKTDSATRIRAYESGADDFLTKPIDPEEFVIRIRRLTRRRRRLTGQLLLDQTTGAYGIPFLERELSRQIALSGESNESLSLAAVELEGLRSLNEQQGYRSGDQMLKTFSDAIRRQLRPRDIWARDRANRFFLLQPGLTQEQSQAFIEHLLQQSELQDLFKETHIQAIYASVAVDLHASQQTALGASSRALDAARLRLDGEAVADPSPQSRQLRLAIIDDDPLIRMILERQLVSLEAEYSLDIRLFADGEEFLSDPWHVGGFRYLLILDRMMPRMNGMEVLSRLRSGNYPAVYTVLMLTGVGDERGIAEAIRTGTDDYMTKPFSMVELEARVRRLLGKVGSPV